MVPERSLVSSWISAAGWFDPRTGSETRRNVPAGNNHAVALPSGTIGFRSRGALRGYFFLGRYGAMGRYGARYSCRNA
jgi:ribosomal protein L37AE/L43A